MNTETREMTIGGLVIVGLGLAFGLSYWADRVAAKAGAESGHILIASFNRVDGLADGAEVRLGGIRVGTVIKQVLTPDFRAVLTLRLDRDPRLPVDSSVAIHTDGLFGGKFVVLDAGGEDDVLASGDAISYTQDAVVVAELLELIISEGKAKRARAAAAKAKTQEGGQ